MEYWIMNTYHNLWKIIQNGNNKKRSGRDSKGGIIILPPFSFEEHVAVKRDTKARTLLLQSLPEDHMVDFHHLDDAREIWLAVKARFGGNEESKKMRKTMLKQAFLEFNVSKEEGLHKGYDRSLEIDVKGGSSYGSRSTAVALTHSSFIGTASINTKMVYSDQQSYSSLISYNPVPAGCIMEDVLHSFVAENEPTQQLAYEDFKQTEEAEQVYGLMARFESDFAVPAGNAAGGVNPAAAEFSMMGISPKVQTCPFGYDSKLSNLKKNYEHLEKLYNDSFIQVQAHKNIVKTLESQKDWYHQTQLALKEKVKILSANLENTTNTLKYSKTLNAQANIEKQEWEVNFVESLARFDKWKESSKNLAKLLSSSMSTRTKLVLGFKEHIGSDEVCDLSTPSVFSPEPDNREVKSLYESDKSSASKTYDFASCVSSPKTNDSFSTVDVKILPKSDVKDPSPTNGFSSCSFKENVESTRNLCNKSRIADRIHCKNNFVRSKKCFVCGSKSHLIKDCHVYDTVDNFPSVVLKAASVPAASRNRSASIHAGRHIPAGRSNKPTPFPAGRTVPTGWTNHDVVLGEITDLTCNGVPRTMVDLINLHS
nr:xylulose kinase-1 [Tanacetum cinerariifolium]